MSHNKLTSAADLEHLIKCKELSVIDLSHNQIDDPDVVDIFEQMPSLVCCDMWDVIRFNWWHSFVITYRYRDLQSCFNI